MKIRTITSCLMAGIYLLIGTAGHFASPDLQSHYFNQSHQVSAETKGSPNGQRPFWAKKKHFPPAPQVPNSQHLRSSHSAAPVELRGTAAPVTGNIVPSIFLRTVSAKPRDPPTA